MKVLLDAGKAYIAFDTPEELDAKRKEVPNFQYDASTRLQMRNSLTLPKEEVDALIASGTQYVVRFRIEPNEDVHVNDLIRGDVVINSSILDDKVLYKSADELPTYHLANIVDDHLMEISHVIRGEEWLPSAPLHVLLYRAFGWEDTMPAFAHLPLLLKPEGNGKLSKRDGDRLGFPVFPLEWHDPKTGEVSSGYREAGYLPEAVINFLALLGWNPGNDQELMSMDELVSLFSLSHCSKAGAKFDYKKGIWFNHEYILRKPDAEVAMLFTPVLEAHGVNPADYTDYVKPDKVRFNSTSCACDDVYSFTCAISDFPLGVTNAWGAGLFNILLYAERKLSHSASVTIADIIHKRRVTPNTINGKSVISAVSIASLKIKDSIIIAAHNAKNIISDIILAQ